MFGNMDKNDYYMFYIEGTWYNKKYYDIINNCLCVSTEDGPKILKKLKG